MSYLVMGGRDGWGLSVLQLLNWLLLQQVKALFQALEPCSEPPAGVATSAAAAQTDPSWESQLQAQLHVVPSFDQLLNGLMVGGGEVLGTSCGM
jgi:hypothetical protein